VNVEINSRNLCRRQPRRAVSLVAGARLNSYFPSVPPGTLAANLIGGYIIGLAIAFFAAFPQWRQSGALDHHGILRWADDVLDIFG